MISWLKILYPINPFQGYYQFFKFPSENSFFLVNPQCPPALSLLSTLNNGLHESNISWRNHSVKLRNLLLGFTSGSGVVRTQSCSPEWEHAFTALPQTSWESWVIHLKETPLQEGLTYCSCGLSIISEARVVLFINCNYEKSSMSSWFLSDTCNIHLSWKKCYFHEIHKH